MGDINTWGLDVFSASRAIKDGRVLTGTTFTIFRERKLCETFHIDEKVLLTFLMTLEDHYLKVRTQYCGESQNPAESLCSSP